MDRSRLLGISGGSRKIQISIAAEKNLRDYPCPAGGCILTDKNFSDRFRDYLRFTKRPSVSDIPLLKVGRHFRHESGDNIIVARNENECRMLKDLYRENDHLLVPLGFSGPVVILQGDRFGVAVDKMLEYTKRYVDKNTLIKHCHIKKKIIVSLHEVSQHFNISLDPSSPGPENTLSPTDYEN
ncbi:hypothetical protein ACFLZG_02695 [Thermodesulfobacteriota bacterium]